LERFTKSKNFNVALVVAVFAVAAGCIWAWSADRDYQVVAAVFLGWVGAVGAAWWLFRGLDDGPGHSMVALRDVLDGRTPRRPPQLPAGEKESFDSIEQLAEQLAQNKREGSAIRETADRVQRELELVKQRAADQESVKTSWETRAREAEARLEAHKRTTDDLEREKRMLDDEAKAMRRQVRESEERLTQYLDLLSNGFGEQMAAVEETTRSMQEMAQQLHQIAQHVEALASNAEESSSSILEMTATNDEVAENTGNLASSVRETVSSIEEMTYSIKEVARNVDALSLTAEETSSSMNEMDVSIDQVQSNANETARLSEQVASDAEIGADAILKTIQEINRIKETSSEAVQVISNLGTRIEAIGDILDVIDDVAEQTNLLALNAAIIAAQAGEHGKGFAVVADEIKDLAERAGASTREIADLIKTIQAESKKGITAVERGAATVDRGVEVSAHAETALKKILESSQKSTAMVRAIARATVEQAKGSKQVTDAIGRIAETVQQIAAATAEQARGSELIMKSAEKMRLITQHVERSSQEQARGGRQISQAIENISSMVNQLHTSHRAQARGSEQTIQAAKRIQDLTRAYEAHLRELSRIAERLRQLSS
jgi:methyl-accepting chemotaxis protein